MPPLIPCGRVSLNSDEAVLRLDLGPVGSHVDEGFYPLSAGQVDFDVCQPPRSPAWLGPAGQLVPQGYLAFNEHSAITRDGVSSVDDLVLRIDLPDGEYRIRLVFGRLDRACCSMQVSFNGEPVAEDLHARHFARRGVPDFLHGFPRGLRRIVRIEEGVLRISIRGDHSAFRERFLEEVERMARLENEFASHRWPHVTTEMIGIDRVYFLGMGNAARASIGIGLLGTRPIVTYAGLGRDFAAVLSVDARSLRVALYASLTPRSLRRSCHGCWSSGLSTGLKPVPTETETGALARLLQIECDA